MSAGIERRALNVLFRNHPDTKAAEWYEWDTALRARDRREQLLRWSATLSDSQLLAMRNLGVTALAWIRQAADERHIHSYVCSCGARAAFDDIDRPRLRFGQEIVLDCGPEWGGDQTLYVGWTERTESLSVSGQFLSSGSSREYVLQDPVDAPSAEAIARVYPEVPA